jgi:O-antigen/teichoic acid export membrane protein
MSHSNKVIAKNSFILFVRLILTTLFGLVSIRIVIQSLGDSDYGLYTVISGIVMIFVFLNSAMTSTTYRFIAYEMGRNNQQGINKVFNISLVMHLMIAILILFLTETIGVYYVHNHLNVELNKIPDAIFILRLSTFSTFIHIICVPYQGLLVAKENFLIAAKIEVLRGFLGLMIALIIFNVDEDKLRLYVVLVSVISIIPALLFVTYCFSNYRDDIKWSLQRTKNDYIEMLVFSGWTMIGGAAGMVKNSGAALVVNSFFGTILNASFGIANQVNNMVQMFSQSLGQAAIPQITKSYSAGDTNRMKNLSVFLTKYIFFLMLIPAWPILLETEFILKLWLGKVPPFTTVFVQLLIINAMVDSLGGFSAIAQATGKIKYFQIISSTLSILSLPIAYVLYQFKLPAPTIIIVFISTSLINLFCSMILLKRIINFDIYFYLKTVHLKVFYVLLYIIGLFLIKYLFHQGWIRFFIMECSAITLVFFSIYRVGLLSEEKVILKQYMHILFQKIKFASVCVQKTKENKKLYGLLICILQLL